jgi:hypothetical protein
MARKKKKRQEEEEDRRVKGDPPVFTKKLNSNIDTCFQSTSVSFSHDVWPSACCFLEGLLISYAAQF